MSSVQTGVNRPSPVEPASTARILIVEDDPILRRSLNEILKDEGYQVDTAADGEEGLEAVQRSDYEAVLSDIKMPRMDGMRFLRLARQQRPHLPFIMLTGYPTIDLALRAMQQGAYDFVYKPFRVSALLQVLERALNREKTEQKGESAPSPALAAKHLDRTVRRKLIELSALESLHQEMGRSVGFSGMADKVVQVLGKVFECRHAALFLKGTGNGSMRLVSTIGLAQEEQPARAALLALARHLDGKDQPAAILEASTLPPDLRGQFSQSGSGAKPPFLTARLRTEEGSIGMLVLSNKQGAMAFTPDELDLITVFSAQIGIFIEKENLFETIREENRRNKAELAIAQKVQVGLLPSRLPQRKGIRLAVHSRPARTLGGDFYGFVENYESTVRFFMGDVAGKGVPAALIMSMATNVIREHGKRYRSPDKILQEANASLRGYLGTDSVNYVTAFFGILDLAKMELRYAKAGHERPVLYRGKRKYFEWLDAPGRVLGLFDEIHCQARKVKVEEGDRLFLFTDGMVDATNRDGEGLGIERLQAMLDDWIELPPKQIKDNLCSFIEEWGGGTEQKDDETFLVMEVGYKGWEQREIPSIMERADTVKAEIYEYLRTLEIPSPLFDDLRFAIREVVSNAIEHGNKGDPGKRLHLSWLADDREFRLKVKDEGDGFRPSSLPDPTDPENACRPRGRGIFMLRSLLDRVEWNAQGNEIMIVKNLDNPSIYA